MGEPRRAPPRGAGKAGGLLFLAVLAFVGSVAVGALTGPARLLAGGVLFAAVIALGVNVGRR